MNDSSEKVILPPNSLIKFYYWYSYFTLFLTWMITPILFYVIFTQSKNLKSFKWLLLNHSFWCLAFETFFSTVKPLLLMPAPGGFPIGLLKNGSFKITAAASLIGFSFVTNSITALIATLLSRYLLVFPSRFDKCFSLKLFIWGMVFVTIIVYLCLAVMFALVFNTDEAIVREWALEYDPLFETLMQENSGFFFIPYFYAKTPSLIILILCILLLALGGGLSIFFAILVKSHKSMVTAAKLKRSLIISCIVQIWCANIFLFIPVVALVSTVRFQVKNSAETLCYCCCLINTHAFLEFVATLYYVSPYRAFLANILSESYLYKKLFIRTQHSTPLVSVKI